MHIILAEYMLYCRYSSVTSFFFTCFHTGMNDEFITLNNEDNVMDKYLGVIFFYYLLPF